MHDEKDKPKGSRGLGRIYERNGTWWIQFYFRGQIHRESSKSTIRSKAVALLRKRHAEMGTGRLVGPSVERTSFEDLAKLLINDYVISRRRSLDRAELALEHLREHFGRSLALDITYDRMSAYVVERLKTVKPATVKLELSALGRAFTLAVRAGKMTHRPLLPTIKISNTRSGFFEEAELRRVLDQLRPELRDLIEFVHATGWRIGEAKALTWRQVDFTSGMLRLEPGTTKNGQARAFPYRVLPRLDALLRSLREHTSALEREEGRIIAHVFHRHGRPIGNFHAAWRAACDRARVPGRLVHDLRRTCVRNFERAGVPRSVAMKLTGHLTESVYLRYAIVSESDLADGVRRVAALQSASATSAPREEEASSDANTDEARDAASGVDV